MTYSAVSPQRPGSARASLALRRAAAAWCLAAAGAFAQPVVPRVALVIGNADYAAAPLANPRNDAKAVAGVLRAQGFTVVELRDAGKAQMEAGITLARESLKGRNGVGLLYYAGHALQLDWRNYLIPVDARLQSAADVARQTIDVQQVIDAFRAAGTRMNIVVLDACRDNPFGASGSGKGLAQMDAPAGTFLAYATAPGSVADDGTAQAGNGLYTRHLIQQLRQPGARIEDIFKRVRFQVRRESQGRQVPWESTSLEDDFRFDRGITVPQRLTGTARDQAFEREKAEWDRIKDSKNADDYFAYLDAYPSGLFSEAAQMATARLQSAAGAPADAARSGGAGPRYVVGDRYAYEMVDGLAGKTSTYELFVTAADEAGATFNGAKPHSVTQDGSVIRDRYAAYDPPVLQRPADMAVGKRWRTAYDVKFKDGSTSRNYWDLKVVAVDDIEVRAGRMKAFRVEGDGEGVYTAGKSGTYVFWTRYWVDPVSLILVKSERRHWHRDKLAFWERHELLSMERAPR